MKNRYEVLLLLCLYLLKIHQIDELDSEGDYPLSDYRKHLWLIAVIHEYYQQHMYVPSIPTILVFLFNDILLLYHFIYGRGIPHTFAESVNDP